MKVSILSFLEKLVSPLRVLFKSSKMIAVGVVGFFKFEELEKINKSIELSVDRITGLLEGAKKSTGKTSKSVEVGPIAVATKNNLYLNNRIWRYSEN